MCSEKDKEYVSLKYGINTDYFLGDDNDDDDVVDSELKQAWRLWV